MVLRDGNPDALRLDPIAFQWDASKWGCRVLHRDLKN